MCDGGEEKCGQAKARGYQTSRGGALTQSSSVPLHPVDTTRTIRSGNDLAVAFTAAVMPADPPAPVKKENITSVQS